MDLLFGVAFEALSYEHKISEVWIMLSSTIGEFPERLNSILCCIQTDSEGFRLVVICLTLRFWD